MKKLLAIVLAALMMLLPILSMAEGVELTMGSWRTDDTEKVNALLEKYFLVIDPTAVNHQGEDFGIQYRTGIYYADPADGETAARALSELAQRYDRPLAVENKPLENFYPAEEYHQKYLEKHPDGYCHIHFD